MRSTSLFTVPSLRSGKTNNNGNGIHPSMDALRQLGVNA